MPTGQSPGHAFRGFLAGDYNVMLTDLDILRTGQMGR
jgi:hypothetical protein